MLVVHLVPLIARGGETEAYSEGLDELVELYVCGEAVVARLVLDPAASDVEHCEAQDTEEDAAVGVKAPAGSCDPRDELTEP